MKSLLLSLFTIIFLSGCGEGNRRQEKIIEKEIDSVVTTNIEADYERVKFESLDGLMISANLYEIDKNAPVILLCHQARFNKFEYDGVAQKLNELGYNCLAIDQRSGGPIASQMNETNIRAKENNLGVDYLDAIPDIKAAVSYAWSVYGQDVILWGSSYSSTLVLYEAVSNDNVRAVVSFSPGNYFAEQLGSLVDTLADFEKPLFITSAKNEIPMAEELLQKVPMNENQVHFKPEGEGWHGSRALWPHQEGGEEYWEAITEWLESLEK